MCSPLNEAEKASGETPIVTVTPSSNEIAVLTAAKRGKTYTFDKVRIIVCRKLHVLLMYVFNVQVFGQYSTQEEVFSGSIVPIIDEVLTGFNCTVFAYGQTGTGKTHTMEGEMGAGPLAGVIPRSLHMIFDKLQRNATEYSVRLSFLELYNEVCAIFVSSDLLLCVCLRRQACQS